MGQPLIVSLTFFALAWKYDNRTFYAAEYDRGLSIEEIKELFVDDKELSMSSTRFLTKSTTR